MRKVEMSTSRGYRDQLDRARRFLERVRGAIYVEDDPCEISDVEYQDTVWAFFQNCWHIKDWVKHDSAVPEQTRQRVIEAAESSAVLYICQDMANGTKHLKLTRPQAGAGARHGHMSTTIVQGLLVKFDCVIVLADGSERSAREVACECMEEWVKILEREDLATARLS